jgi:hypothetical protein
MKGAARNVPFSFAVRLPAAVKAGFAETAKDANKTVQEDV